MKVAEMIKQVVEQKGYRNLRSAAKTPRHKPGASEAHGQPGAHPEGFHPRHDSGQARPGPVRIAPGSAPGEVPLRGVRVTSFPRQKKKSTREAGLAPFRGAVQLSREDPERDGDPDHQEVPAAPGRGQRADHGLSRLYLGDEEDHDEETVVSPMYVLLEKVLAGPLCNG